MLHSLPGGCILELLRFEFSLVTKFCNGFVQFGKGFQFVLLPRRGLTMFGSLGLVGGGCGLVHGRSRTKDGRDFVYELLKGFGEFSVGGNGDFISIFVQVGHGNTGGIRVGREFGNEVEEVLVGDGGGRFVP